jgi:hypothetical protein
MESLERRRWLYWTTDEMSGVDEWLGYREGEIESLMEEMAKVNELALEAVLIT